MKSYKSMRVTKIWGRIVAMVLLAAIVVTGIPGIAEAEISRWEMKKSGNQKLSSDIPDSTWVDVDNWDSLKTYLQTDGTMYIRLANDIKYEIGTVYDDNGVPMRGERGACKGITIYGEKYIDLNGKELLLDDCSNASDGSGKHSVKRNCEGTFLIVDSTATVTVCDSQFGGKIRTDGYYIGNYRGMAEGTYNDFYIFTCRRDAVVVNGQLILEGGKIEAGGSKKQYFTRIKKEDLSTYGSLDGDSFKFVYQVIEGNGVTVNKGGSLISYGGEVSGCGEYSYGIVAREGAYVRFYDGLVYGCSSASCFSVADGADVRVYSGEFKTGYHENYRSVDSFADNGKVDGWDEQYQSLGTMSVTILFFFGFGSGFGELPAAEGEHMWRYHTADYGVIGLPEKCFNVDYQGIRTMTILQNMRNYDDYEANFKGDVKAIPKDYESGFTLLAEDKNNDYKLTTREFSYSLGESNIVRLGESTKWFYENEFIEWEDYYPLPDYKGVFYSKNRENSYCWAVRPYKEGKYVTVMETTEPYVDFAEIAEAAHFEEGKTYQLACMQKFYWSGYHLFDCVNKSSAAVTVKVEKECTHNWKFIENTADCTNGGKKVYFCQNCYSTKEENCNALGHEIVSNGYATGELSVVDNDNHGKYCARCEQWISKNAHTWEVAGNNDYCDETVTVYVCSDGCGAIKKEALKKATGETHTFEEECHWGADSHWWFCSKCGYQKAENHNWENSGGGTETCYSCGYSRGGAIESGDYLSVGLGTACAHVTMRAIGHFDNKEWEAAYNNETYASMEWAARINGVKTVLGTGKSFSPTPDILNRLDNGDIWLTVDFTGEGIDICQLCISYKRPTRYIAERPATCFEQGRKAHFVCNCGTVCDQAGNKLSDITIPVASHVYSNECDNVCDTCGQVTAQEKHKAGNQWICKDGAHWHTCVSCGEKMDYAECSASGWITDAVASCTTEGRSHKECTVCKTKLAEYTTPKVHDYSYVRVEPTGSSTPCRDDAVCSNCGDEYSIVYDNSDGTPDRLTVEGMEVPEVSYVEGFASTCVSRGIKGYYLNTGNYEKAEDSEGLIKWTEDNMLMDIDPDNHIVMMVHDGEQIDYCTDENAHWIECECGTVLDKADHDYDDNKTCKVCGYSTIEDDHGEGVVIENLRNRYRRIFILCLVAVIAGIAVMIVSIIVIVRRKKLEKHNDSDKREIKDDSQKEQEKAQEDKQEKKQEKKQEIREDIQEKEEG